MIKRAIDVVGAAAGLFFLSPIVLLCAAAVAWSMGRPVLFRQQRPGQGGRPFGMIKFRTMSDARDANGRLLSDGERLTRVGRFLRATSLDELPELWNVLMGDMSLVGPRPLLMVYLERYSSEQARRHDVKPGVTGWAQVNGRNAISWDEKFALDTWYVDNRSLWLDLKILYATVAQVIRRKDINSTEAATMPEFMGSNGK
ncbi:sugar transferase [Sphingomonas sp. dw_22]|uniref:sugar transferase n=1 Tax=Sphingomonas sp. dw_22 TaxID=2721175 RepID=UPI001BD28AED|nr:sugar transferase [Sphingomonas sp. dw_22]